MAQSRWCCSDSEGQREDSGKGLALARNYVVSDTAQPEIKGQFIDDRLTFKRAPWRCGALIRPVSRKRRGYGSKGGCLSQGRPYRPGRAQRATTAHPGRDWQREKSHSLLDSPLQIAARKGPLARGDWSTTDRQDSRLKAKLRNVPWYREEAQKGSSAHGSPHRLVLFQSSSGPLPAPVAPRPVS
jgi:hypothetical protein